MLHAAADRGGDGSHRLNAHAGDIASHVTATRVIVHESNRTYGKWGGTRKLNNYYWCYPTTDDFTFRRF